VDGRAVTGRGRRLRACAGAPARGLGRTSRPRAPGLEGLVGRVAPSRPPAPVAAFPRGTLRRAARRPGGSGASGPRASRRVGSTAKGRPMRHLFSEFQPTFRDNRDVFRETFGTTAAGSPYRAAAPTVLRPAYAIRSDRRTVVLRESRPAAPSASADAIGMRGPPARTPSPATGPSGVRQRSSACAVGAPCVRLLCAVVLRPSKFACSRIHWDGAASQCSRTCTCQGDSPWTPGALPPAGGPRRRPPRPTVRSMSRHRQPTSAGAAVLSLRLSLPPC